MATKTDRKRRGNGKPASDNVFLYKLAVSLLGLGFGLLHRWHVSTLFENDRHFSHLSEIEREMSFRTEMGMYYYYYKTIVESKDFTEGLNKLRHDNLSEYGNVINACRKYNLLPEITAGFLYHSAKNLGIISKQECWEIERGEGLSPVTSCEGLAVPVYFYLETVWFSTVLTATVLFYYSTYLGDSILSGLITIALFFYNHNECTRVQWSPPLRESFAYPVLLYQMYRLTTIIKRYQDKESLGNIRIGMFVDLCFSSIISLQSWQFSHFVFTTQAAALLILKWFKIIPEYLHKAFCIVYVIADVITLNFFKGTWHLGSLHLYFLMFSDISSYLLSKASRHLNVPVKTALEIVMTILLTKWAKTGVNEYVIVSDDESHVYDILRSKISDYRDFHTMLYTCLDVFDFLQYKTFEVIIKTLLLPSAILAGMLALYYWYRNFQAKGYPMCVEADVAYSGLQTGAFIIMALFIMRLKLFMTPHLCIIAGAVCSRRYLEKVGIKNELTRGAIFVLLLACMSYHGAERLKEERGVMGEYSNIEQEELFEWIKQNTPENAVFAGKMSLMANLMLSTRRPIVNNPYYESKEMRDRTMKVYEIFSRRDPASVYVTLRNMKVSYIVLEGSLCLGLADMQPGCQMIDLWDMVDNGTAKAAGKPPLCPILYEGNTYPFRRVFINNNYVVLQVEYSHYVEFKPKTSMPLYYQS